MKTLDQLKPTQAMSVMLYQYLIMEDEQTKRELMGYFKDPSRVEAWTTKEVFERIPNKLTPEQLEGLGSQRAALTLGAKLVNSSRTDGDFWREDSAPIVGWGVTLHQDVQVPVLPEGYAGGDGPLPVVSWERRSAGDTVYLTPYELMYLLIQPEYAGSIPMRQKGSMLSFAPKLRSLLGAGRFMPTPAFSVRNIPQPSVEGSLDKLSDAPVVGRVNLDRVDLDGDVQKVGVGYGRSIAAFMQGSLRDKEGTVFTATSGAAHLLDMYVKNNCLWPTKALEIMGRLSLTEKNRKTSVRADFMGLLKEEVRNLPEEQLAVLRTHAEFLLISSLLIADAYKMSRRVGLHEHEVHSKVVGCRVEALQDVTLLLVPDDYIAGTRPDSLTAVVLKQGQTMDLTLYDLMFTLSQPQFSGYASVEGKPLECRSTPKFTAVKESKKEVPTPTFAFGMLGSVLPRLAVDYRDEVSIHTGRRGWGIKPEFEKRFSGVYLESDRIPLNASSLEKVVSAIKKLLDAQGNQLDV